MKHEPYETLEIDGIIVERYQNYNKTEPRHQFDVFCLEVKRVSKDLKKKGIKRVQWDTIGGFKCRGVRKAIAVNTLNAVRFLKR